MCLCDTHLLLLLTSKLELAGKSQSDLHPSFIGGLRSEPMKIISDLNFFVCKIEIMLAGNDFLSRIRGEKV